MAITMLAQNPRKPTQAQQAAMLFMAALGAGQDQSYPGGKSGMDPSQVGGPDQGRPTAAHLAGQLTRAGGHAKQPWSAARAAEINAKYGPGAAQRRADRLARGIHLSHAHAGPAGQLASGGALSEADYNYQVHQAQQAGLLPGQSQGSRRTGNIRRQAGQLHPLAGNPHLALLRQLLQAR